MGAMGALISATRTNAELFRLEDQIGTIEAGKQADLILVEGDVLNDIGCLVDALNVKVVIKAGAVAKSRL